MTTDTAAGLAGLVACAERLQALTKEQAVERVAVEYTRLFIGPGTPAAPPWETLYREGGTVLFGQPTFAMRQLFREAGYKASPNSHQFEDHLGFELLYIAMTCARFAEAEPTSQEVENLASFIQKHPLSFIAELHAKAQQAVEEAHLPNYYPPLIELIWGVLRYSISPWKLSLQ